MRRPSVIALVAALVAAAAATAQPSASAPATARLLRLEQHLAPSARTKPQLVLMTLGGPIYCGQLRALARNVGASLVCTDYGPNRYVARGERAGRHMDWGDPAYLAEAARVPDRLRAEGVKIAKLVLVGVSYSGYANAELVATHPELRPDALIVVDSYLDLPARYRALRPTHPTKAEIEEAMGGTLAERPQAYEQRSPSHHLAGLAAAVRGGMRFVDVWSTSDRERREFRGATCGPLANARWLSELAGVLGRPVTGYVTRMPHAHALWDRGQGLLALAGIRPAVRTLAARALRFEPDGAGALPAGSFCSA